MSSGPTTVKLVYGLEETRKDLGKLQRTTRRKILRRAVRAGVRVLQIEARRRVPVRTGALKKAIAIRADNRPYGVKGLLYITSTVKVRRSINQPGKYVRATGRGFAGTVYPRAYAHLVEFGTQPHYLGQGSERTVKVKRGGKWVREGRSRNTSGRRHPGARAKPFLRPTYDAKKEEVAKVIAERLGEEVRKEAATLGMRRRRPKGVTS